METINASVGMHNNGTTNCFNQPADVVKIVKLLNLIPASEGGTAADKLSASPSASQLYRAIRHFQQVQNDLGRRPRLSVDGHVDPGAPTLGRLNQLASTPAPAASTRIVHSIAALCWIDQRLYDKEDLPEVDHFTKAPDVIDRQALLARRGYRFLNFLEAYIVVNDKQQIIDQGFTDDSKNYYGPSFRGIMPFAFPEIRSFTAAADGQSVTFVQTVGCKTVSPETIGAREAVKQADGILGIHPGWGGPLGVLFETPAAKAGAKVAENFRVFPPIWTQIELTISNDAGFDAKLARHSLFPSCTFYRQKYGVEKLAFNVTNYMQVENFDARPNIEEWRRKGWGILVNDSGPSGGNPWGVPDPRILGRDLPFRPGIPSP
jgi:hypothetical protein